MAAVCAVILLFPTSFSLFAMSSADAVVVILNSRNATSKRNYEAAREIVMRDAAAGKPLQQFVIGVTTDDKDLAKRYLDASRDRIRALAEKKDNPMAINSKQKGKKGELELVHKLKEHGFETHRSVQYNGKAEEGQPDLVGLSGIHIECKRVEKLNIYDAIDQAKRDCKSSEIPFNDKIPAVFHRKNNCEWLVTMTLDDWVQIYREWCNGRC